MGRARRARKIAATAAYGGGGVAAAGAALGLIGYAVVRVEGAIARRIVGSPYDNAPEHEGIYGAGIGEPLDLILLGDSLSAGLGAESGEQTIGAIVAGSVAALTARRVRLTNRAVVGAESTDLERQLGSALDEVDSPALVLIFIGANDVTNNVGAAVGARAISITGALALAAASLLLGIGWKTAIVVGLALALSSTAIGLQILSERKELHSGHGRLAFAILLLQVALMFL